MFIGEFQHTMDKKGRINIPSKFRESLGESFYVTKGLDSCLFVFPEREWARFEEKLKELPLASRDARIFTRMFFAGAAECQFDRQGRIIIPPVLRQHGELEKEVVIIGVSTRIEIWGKARWEAYNAVDNVDYDDIAEKMALLGI